MTNVRLIPFLASSPLLPPPPPSPILRPPPISIQSRAERRVEGGVSLAVGVSRRIVSLTQLPLAVLPLALSGCCPPAVAFSLGISGPKEWLRVQKKNAARFVLAPIDASRRSLQAAYLLLSVDSWSQIENPGELRKLFNSAARDCVPEDRSSIVAFQARTGVEVCTFRLIVKNAASLSDKYDPLKLEAEEKLDNLIRILTVLGRTIDDVDLQIESDRQKVKDGLNETIFALGKFEESIKGCLGV